VLAQELPPAKESPSTLRALITCTHNRGEKKCRLHFGDKTVSQNSHLEHNSTDGKTILNRVSKGEQVTRMMGA
jgi:hypothetical protein